MHPGQVAVDANLTRFNVVDCGRRFGKTKYGMRKLGEPALAGAPVAYMAPIYPMVTEVYRELDWLLGPIVTRRTEGRRLELQGGGVIDFWSMENGADRIRGRKYKRVVLDECAMVTGLLTVWEKVVRPTLTDLRGDAFFLSTPRRGSGFQTFYDRGQGDDPEWRSWQMPTSANPFIDPAEIEAARRGMSEQAFAQEYLADFEASESDLVYPEFNATMVRTSPIGWRDCKWRVVGIDPGGGDPTAIVPLGVDDREHIHQYGEFARPNVSLEEVAAFLHTLGAVDFVMVGETGGTVITSTLQRMGFPAYQADMGRAEGLETVRWLLQAGRISIDPGCRASIKEFGEYRWAKRRDSETGERYATRAAADHHADLMDARRYAVMGLLRALPGAEGPIETRWK